MTPFLVIAAALVLFTAAAAYCDWRTGQIPNRLIVVGLAVAVPLHAAARWFTLRALSKDAGAELTFGLVSCAVGLLVCALAPLLLFRFKGIGGGDVKLLATVGAFAGPLVGMEIQFYSALLLLFFVAARLVYSGELVKTLRNSVALLQNPFLPHARRRALPEQLMARLPFAPSVFATALLLSSAQLLTIAIRP